MSRKRHRVTRDAAHHEGFTQPQIEGAETKIPLGFQVLDKLNTGFKRGELRLICAGTRGVSKTFPPGDLIAECKTQADFDRLWDLWYGPGTAASLRMSAEIEGPRNLDVNKIVGL